MRGTFGLRKCKGCKQFFKGNRGLGVHKQSCGPYRALMGIITAGTPGHGKTSPLNMVITPVSKVKTHKMLRVSFRISRDHLLTALASHADARIVVTNE